MSNRLIELQLYHLRLPFRHSFSHAAAQRAETDTVLVAALLADGAIGFGEGVPRPYVTGETIESVLYNISDTFAGALKQVEPKSFPELLDLIENLPFTNEQNQIINSARSAVELALLDAYARHYQSSLSSIAGWLGCGFFTGDASIHKIRVSGVLDGADPAKMLKQLRLMRWYGLKNFKLKVGYEHDIENLNLINKKYHKALSYGKMSLRVDANGAWDIDAAVAMSEKLVGLNVCCLEQPLAPNDQSHFRTIADLSRVPLMADESLLTVDDAEYLAENDLIDYFNIRISKNGGLIPAIKIAEIAHKYGKSTQLGAMVGEGAVLAAAGRQFLQMTPNVEFTEICYSTFLLKNDIADRNIRFGYGGKIPKIGPLGLGLEIPRKKISRFLVEPPRKITLA